MHHSCRGNETISYAWWQWKHVTREREIQSTLVLRAHCSSNFYHQASAHTLHLAGCRTAIIAPIFFSIVSWIFDKRHIQFIFAYFLVRSFSWHSHRISHSHPVSLTWKRENRMPKNTHAFVHWMLVRARSFNILWFHACLLLSVTILCLLRSTTAPKCQLHHGLLMPSSSTSVCKSHHSLAVRKEWNVSAGIESWFEMHTEI